MRYAPRSAAVLGLAFTVYMAAVARGQSPTTRPTDARILVLPFTALNAGENQAWLGRSIQQSILADLTTAAPGRLMSIDAEASDTASAAEAGRKAGAAYVVQGSFTTMPGASGAAEIRLLGQVIEVGSGRPVTGFKATGPYNDIFRLEDQVANQVRSRLAAAGVLAAPPVITLSAPPRVPEEVAAPPQVNAYYQEYGSAPQAYPAGSDNAYYNYYYANPYPAYTGYGYGGPVVGLGFGTSFFFGSFYPHGSRFGGFDHDRFGVHHGHGAGFGGHSGGSHGSSGATSGGAGRAAGGHR